MLVRHLCRVRTNEDINRNVSTEEKYISDIFCYSLTPLNGDAAA